MMKKYCNNCKNLLRPPDINDYQNYICAAKQNVGNWLDQDHVRYHPSIINSDNDCPWWNLKTKCSKLFWEDEAQFGNLKYDW